MSSTIYKAGTQYQSDSQATWYVSYDMNSSSDQCTITPCGSFGMTDVERTYVETDCPISCRRDGKFRTLYIVSRTTLLQIHYPNSDDTMPRGILPGVSASHEGRSVVVMNPISRFVNFQPGYEWPRISIAKSPVSNRASDFELSDTGTIPHEESAGFHDLVVRNLEGSGSQRAECPGPTVDLQGWICEGLGVFKGRFILELKKSWHSHYSPRDEESILDIYNSISDTRLDYGEWQAQGPQGSYSVHSLANFAETV
ncbi:hypothetical protein BDN71DRAFT_1510238 [Pleurotus eryngii]|uniref:Uncharacterized protein n=1 Tax=Pleurotus eryngii TaxID=5323 RepID=A0A9P5ZPZ2_PLEER|nr:hypothetical protein BDN71DRAFT_1510238 [Pleurotus eryngii]